MFHQSSSRNHRSKGSNVKKILQVVVLLAVACWLIYQVKHSRDKRTEYSGNDEIKLSNGGKESYLGRKGDAGSENVVIIDTSAQVSDESTEMKQGEVQHDAVNNEDKSKEGPQSHELEDSHANDEEETLRLPSENSKEEGRTLEEHGHLKENEKIEDINSDLTVGDNVEATMIGEEAASRSADQTDSSASSGKGNEETHGEVSNQELSVDNESPKVEGVDSDGHNSSISKTDDENKIDHAGDDAHSDDDNVSSSQSKAASTNSEVDDVFHAGDTVESQGYTTHEVEATGVQNTEASNEVSKEGEVQAQLGSVSEVENTDSNSLGEIKTDSKSQNEEAEKSSSSAEAQNNNDASSNVSVESQQDKASDAESTTNADDVQESPSALEANNNEIVEPEGNYEDAKVEKEDSQRGDAVEAGHSENNSLDAKNDKETSEQIEKSSEAIEQSGSDDPQQEIIAGEAGEAQGTGDGKSEGNSDDAAGSDSGNEISGMEKEGGTVNEEEKNEAVLNDEATKTSEVNEKTNSGDSTNKTPTGEGVQAQGDDISEPESTNNSNTGEAKTEESSNTEIEQDSTNLNASSSEVESTEQKAAQ